MKLSGLLISCCLLLFAAQSAVGQTADPLSGTWKGEMGPNGGPRFPITMQLKFDGTATVSGTIEGGGNLAQISSGTYNPQTKALKLQVDVPGDGNTDKFVFDGTISGVTAKGSVAGKGQTGDFQVTKLVEGATAGPLAAADDTATSLKKNFDEVSGWVAKAADMVPADKYSYKPTSDVRTFGQLIAHIADSYEFFCARASGQNVQWAQPIEKAGLDKAAVLGKLKQAQTKCNAAYSSNGRVSPLIENIGHTSLHYGNIITYMRMMGMVPPSN